MSNVRTIWLDLISGNSHNLKQWICLLILADRMAGSILACRMTGIILAGKMADMQVVRLADGHVDCRQAAILCAMVYMDTGL